MYGRYKFLRNHGVCLDTRFCGGASHSGITSTPQIARSVTVAVFRRYPISVSLRCRAIAGGQGEVARQVRTQRIEELTIAGKAIESELLLLREDLNQAKDNVIACSQAFTMLQVFREEFDSLTPGEQADTLKDVIHGIVIKPDQTIVEVFGAGSDSAFVLQGSKTLGNEGLGPATSRSPVRTVFREMGPAGIEPATAGLEIPCSILLSYGPFPIKILGKPYPQFQDHSIDILLGSPSCIHILFEFCGQSLRSNVIPMRINRRLQLGRTVIVDPDSIGHL